MLCWQNKERATINKLHQERKADKWNGEKRLPSENNLKLSDHKTIWPVHKDVEQEITHPPYPATPPLPLSLKLLNARTVLPHLSFLLWTEGVWICLLPPPAHKRKDGPDSFYICYALICFNRTRIRMTSLLLWWTYQLGIFSYDTFNVCCSFVTVNKILWKKMHLECQHGYSAPIPHTGNLTKNSHCCV